MSTKWKLTLFLAFILMFCNAGVSQNLLHYARTTNGEKGECLFPEDDNGNVYFSDVIILPCSADSIILAAKNFISSQNVTGYCRAKELSESPTMLAYDIEMGIGEQHWGIEYWGSPLFVLIRDASRVKFKCVIEARQGKFKYSLINFETNRNTISGEAKNDGQTNIIHWQRVNSLTKERDFYSFNHDASKRETKEKLFDYNAQIAYEAYLYQLEFDAVNQFAQGLANLKVTDDEFMDFQKSNGQTNSMSGTPGHSKGVGFSAFGSGFFTQSDVKSEEITTSGDNIDIDNFKGFLLAKGNHVFVTCGDYDYELAGAKELIKQIIIDGFWAVVDRPEQAHFVIEYHVNLEGRDKAYILIHDVNNQRICDKKWTKGSSESVSENREVARKIYLDSLLPLQQMIEKGECPKYLEIFNTK